MSTFGKNLKEILDALNMSQAEFAHRTGLTCAAVSMILKGKREPSLSTIVKIIKVLPITFERLMRESK